LVSVRSTAPPAVVNVIDGNVSARTSTTNHETAFGRFEDFCRFFPEAYRVAYPGKESRPWILLRRQAHEQVAAALGQ
jgi:hypothetical protein